MDHILQVGLSNALLAAVPAFLALIAARWSKRPALVHALWLLSLVKLLTPPIVNLPIHIETAQTRVAAPLAMPPVAPAMSEPACESAEPAYGPSTSPTTEANSRPAEADSPRSPTPPPIAVPWRELLCAVWLAGSVVLLAIIACRAIVFHRLVRHTKPAPAAVAAQVNLVAGRLGMCACPEIRMVDGAVSPMLWALGRARLLLPEGLWARLSSHEQSALLAHELAHWRRRDHWVRWLELAATLLYWWHPLIWWGRSRMREAEEQCCDAWVLWAWPDGARTYATALVETVDFISQDEAGVPALASGIGPVHRLRKRVIMIMQAQTPRGLSAMGWVLVLAVGLLLLPLMPELTAAEDRKEDDAKPDAPKVEKVLKDEEVRPSDRPDDAKAPRREVRREGETGREGDVVRREGEIRRDVVRRQGETRREGDAPRREGEIRREGDRARQPRPVNGEVMRVEEKTLVVGVGDARRELVVPIDPTTQILINNQPAKLSDLQQGYIVSILQVEGVTKVINARPPRGRFARPTIPAEVVKVENNIATIRIRIEGQELDVLTDEKTDVDNGGRITSVSVLKPGQRVGIMIRNNRAAFVQVIQQEREGERPQREGERGREQKDAPREGDRPRGESERRSLNNNLKEGR